MYLSPARIRNSGDAERLEVIGDVPNDRLHIAFRLPVEGQSDFLAADLAMEAFAGPSMSRLVRRLVRTEQVANSVQAHAMGLVDGVSLGLIAIDIAPGADPAYVETAFVEELTASWHRAHVPSSSRRPSRSLSAPGCTRWPPRKSART